MERERPTNVDERKSAVTQEGGEGEESGCVQLGPLMTYRRERKEGGWVGVWVCMIPYV